MAIELHASIALQGIFNRCFDGDRSVPFHDPVKLAEQPLRERRHRHQTVVAELTRHCGEIETLISTREAVEIKRAKMGGVLVLADHGCPVKPSQYGLRNKTLVSLESEFERVCAVSDANAKLCNTLHDLASERLAIGLSLFFDGSMTLPPERQLVLEQKIKCAAGFARIDTALLDIRRELIIAEMALRYETINNEWIDDMIAYPTGRCRALIDKIQSRLCKAPYPFETTRSLTIDEWAVARGAIPKRLTDMRELPAEIERYRHLLNKLHQRVFSHLSAFAWNAEQFLQSLPDVVETEPADEDFDLIITDA